MPVTQTQANGEIRALTRNIVISGQKSISMTKPELLSVFNAILSIWEAPKYRAAISTAIDGIRPGLTVAQKRRLHEAAMRLAIRERVL